MPRYQQSYPHDTRGERVLPDGLCGLCCGISAARALILHHFLGLLLLSVAKCWGQLAETEYATHQALARVPEAFNPRYPQIYPQQ